MQGFQRPHLVLGNALRAFEVVQRHVGRGAPRRADVRARTGGRAIYSTNDLVGAIKTVMEDDDVIYTLGFYPVDQKMDGAYHSLSVKVAGRGLDVHYRQGYLAADTKVFTPIQRIRCGRL